MSRPTINSLQAQIVDLQNQILALQRQNSDLQDQMAELQTNNQEAPAEDDLSRYHLNWSPEALGVICNRATVIESEIKKQHNYQSVCKIPYYKSGPNNGYNYLSLIKILFLHMM